MALHKSTQLSTTHQTLHTYWNLTKTLQHKQDFTNNLQPFAHFTKLFNVITKIRKSSTQLYTTVHNLTKTLNATIPNIYKRNLLNLTTLTNLTKHYNMGKTSCTHVYTHRRNFTSKLYTTLHNFIQLHKTVVKMYTTLINFWRTLYKTSLQF